MESSIKKILSSITLVLILSLSACSRQEVSEQENPEIDFSALEFTESTDISYAQQFSIHKTSDAQDSADPKNSAGYSLVRINGEKPVLIIEENAPVPGNIPADYSVLQKPLDKTYLVSTSVMDFLIKLDVLDKVKFSGTKKDSWYLSEAVRAMEEGSLVYAGKYSAPDYEILYSSRADLSIQNTMIYHKPEVKEKLEQLGIPVIVEKSSYEKNPLGKLEWIKLYGLLFDREKEAEDFFNARIQEFSSLEKFRSTEKTVAFFYVASNGAVNVRKPGDYIAESIQMAGGRYFLEAPDLEEDSALSTMNMQSEDFYITAKDADILIYNSTIDGMISDRRQLLEKYPLIKDFKAFRNGSVYCTDRTFFQETTGTVGFMLDLNRIMNGADNEDNLQYLVKIR